MDTTSTANKPTYVIFDFQPATGYNEEFVIGRFAEILTNGEYRCEDGVRFKTKNRDGGGVIVDYICPVAMRGMFHINPAMVRTHRQISSGDELALYLRAVEAVRSPHQGPKLASGPELVRPNGAPLS